MIDLNTYKLVHLIAIFALFLALGSAAVSEKAKSRWVAPVHGIALLLILVAGFGMLARLGIQGSLPGWIVGKLVIWFLLGASLAIARRKLLPIGAYLFIVVSLGGIAGALALWKP
jgi:hypothetical protein